MYGIMRVEKRKTQACAGIHAENNRAAERKNFVSSEINWEKTSDNIYFVKSDNFKADIEKDLHAHGIDKWRKDAVTFIDGLYTASPDFFQDKKPEEVERYFKDCLEFHKKTYGDHIINAVVHLDESTPHMHVVSVPIVEKSEIDERLGVPKPTEYRLSAKTLMGGLKDYYKRQDEFYEDVTKGYGLERGETRNPEKRKKHLSVLEYKAQETNKEREKMEEDMASDRKIEEALQKEFDRDTWRPTPLKQKRDIFTGKEIRTYDANDIEVFEKKFEESERIRNRAQGLESARISLKKEMDRQVTDEAKKMARESVEEANRARETAETELEQVKEELENATQQWTIWSRHAENLEEAISRVVENVPGLNKLWEWIEEELQEIEEPDKGI